MKMKKKWRTLNNFFRHIKNLGKILSTEFLHLF
jgi:hypothetical protein